MAGLTDGYPTYAAAMRGLAILVLVAGCDAGKQPAPTTATAPNKTPPTTSGIPIPKDHPTSGILIDKECSLSPHPPSTYFYSSRTTYDLAAGTWSNHHVEGNDTPHAVAPDSEQAPKTKDTRGTLTPEQVREGHTRLAAVLAGGPYEPIYPPSGGGRCTLELYVKGQTPFFSIDRAEQTPDDAVTALMKAF